jgi:hypothetical protein
LRVAGEIAEREAQTRIEIRHIDLANEKIERDKILDIIETEPKQFQLVLYSIFSLSENTKEGIFTGDVYSFYQDLCNKTKNEVLTQRRVSDILAEFDMLGLINARVISKGRQGRSWASPSKGGIYMSCILRPKIAPNGIPRITLLAAVAVARASLAARRPLACAAKKNEARSRALIFPHGELNPDLPRATTNIVRRRHAHY